MLVYSNRDEKVLESIHDGHSQYQQPRQTSPARQHSLPYQRHTAPSSPPSSSSARSPSGGLRGSVSAARDFHRDNTTSNRDSAFRLSQLGSPTQGQGQGQGSASDHSPYLGQSQAQRDSASGPSAAQQHRSNGSGSGRGGSVSPAEHRGFGSHRNYHHQQQQHHYHHQQQQSLASLSSTLPQSPPDVRQSSSEIDRAMRSINDRMQARYHK
jgi:hypothetical protein